MMEFLLIALATWRLSSMIVHEDGPVGVFGWFRDKVGVEYNRASEPIGTNWFAKGIVCVWCVSVWIGVVLTVAFWLIPNLTMYLMLPFGLSAVACIIEAFIEK